MSDEQGGIRQQAGDIASESGEIEEGALGGDFKAGGQDSVSRSVANILKAAGDIATGAT